MHLMLVNDDGIHAPGIRALCAAAAAAGHRVSLCAPSREQSGASHSMSFWSQLRPEKVDVPGAEAAYAVDATPATCARFGLYLIPVVDFVLSGINDGANMGGACVYSGTVSAAIEASMSGVPAMAVSLRAPNGGEFGAAAQVALRVLEYAREHPLPRGCAYNLNVPALPYAQIRGVRAASIAPTYLDSPAYRRAGDGAYLYVHGEESEPLPPGCDKRLVEEGWAALTKLTWNLQMNAPDPDGIAL